MDRVIIRNALALALVQGANFLLPLLTLPYLSRVLGPSQFGAMSLALAVMSYFTLLTDYGFNWSATKQIAENRHDPQAVSRIFWEVMSAKALLAGLSLLGVTLVALVVPDRVGGAAALLAAFPLVLASVMTPGWCFQGMEKMGVSSWCAIVSNAAAVGLTFLLVHQPDDYWLAILARSGCVVLGACLVMGVAFHGGHLRFVPPSLAAAREQLRRGWHVFLSSASIALYGSTNSVILGAMSGTQQVGYFSGADRIRFATQSVVSPLSAAVYPRIGSLINRDRPAAFALIRKLLALQGGGTLLISLGLFAFAPWIVRLALGPGYETSVDVLRLLAPIPFLVGLSNVFGVQTMLNLGMQRPFSRILMLSGAVNVCLLLPLTYLYGARGAAACVMFTEGFVTLAMALTLRRQGIRFLSVMRSKGSPT